VPVPWLFVVPPEGLRSPFLKCRCRRSTSSCPGCRSLPPRAAFRHCPLAEDLPLVFIIPGEMKSADAGPPSIVRHKAPENAAEQSEDRFFMGNPGVHRYRPQLHRQRHKHADSLRFGYQSIRKPGFAADWRHSYRERRPGPRACQLGAARFGSPLAGLGTAAAQSNLKKTDTSIMRMAPSGATF
jgi:hypothetical protein